jgi:hypothetical protein
MNDRPARIACTVRLEVALMRHRPLALAAAAALVLAAGAAPAATVNDASGDYLASFAGAHDADLDVLRFSALFDPGASSFHLAAALAGDINPARAGLYVIGVDTGAGALRPFGGIGAPGVIFDRVILLQKTGSATLGGHALTAAINGDSFTLDVPLADLLPATGAQPYGFTWNLWPRNGLGNNNQISDFAPNNSMLSSTPEPGVWAMLIAGFGLAGAFVRRRRRTSPLAAARP